MFRGAETSGVGSRCHDLQHTFGRLAVVHSHRLLLADIAARMSSTTVRSAWTAGSSSAQPHSSKWQSLSVSTKAAASVREMPRCAAAHKKAWRYAAAGSGGAGSHMPGYWRE